MKSLVALYQQVYYYVWSHHTHKGRGMGYPEKSATVFAVGMVCFNIFSLCMLIQLFLSAISIIIPQKIMYNGGLLISAVFSYSIGIMFDNTKILDKCRLLEKEHRLYPKWVVLSSWITSTVIFLLLVLFFLYGKPA